MMDKWDLIIADYSMPGFSALDALGLLHKSGIDLPFIIVSGTIGEDTAVAAMKSGAHDYILKDRMARLAPAVERELRDALIRQERRSAEDELRKSREELRALAAHLQSVREEERRVISREIHDQLGQALTGFKMDLAWIRHRLLPDNPEVQRELLLEKIGEIGAGMDSAADLVRKICTELRPGILDDLGLVPALEWQTREFSKRTGIACALRLEVKELELDSERSTALFRIFQEMLTNVARHASASRVEASLRRKGDMLLLEVRDDGKGISTEKVDGRRSLGLLGMRERALLFGGTVGIEGKSGQGTIVNVRIPLPAVARAATPPTPAQKRAASKRTGALAQTTK